MKRIYLSTIAGAFAAIVLALALFSFLMKEEDPIKVGILYESDASTKYSENFVRAQEAIERTYGDRVDMVTRFNVREAAPALSELVSEGCDLIFGNSYAFGEDMKRFAAQYPEIQFCQATCSNANEDPALPNYHNFMGEIYQARYISGVVAGMKLEELLKNQWITENQLKVGYVAAYPYAEVISGYTAFFLGVRSVVPSTTMEVIYTNTWSNYSLEKKAAEKLIDRGCVVISQHSDTIGPAAACEVSSRAQQVYHVGYNQNMADIAPTTHLISSAINWEPYMVAAVDAVLRDRKIEKTVKGHVHGYDISAGFDRDWIRMLPLNQVVAADGTQERIDELIEDFINGDVEVFRGPYIGVNPMDETDTYDLSQGFRENAHGSAPKFGYVLKDVIQIIE